MISFPKTCLLFLHLQVTTENGEKLMCRTYQLLDLNSKDHHPSPQYLKVILLGAEQCRLPEDYMVRLRAIEHNGYSGPCDVFDKLMATTNLFKS